MSHPDARISVSGSVFRLSIKPKVAGEVGLPKHAVPTLRISPAGAEGDYNRYRATELHGDPEQALLLVTEDRRAASRPKDGRSSRGIWRESHPTRNS